MTQTQVGFEQVVQEKADGENARVVVVTHETSETKMNQIQEEIKEKTTYKVVSLMKVMGE
jgi:homoserine dehydrogenase